MIVPRLKHYYHKYKWYFPRLVFIVNWRQDQIIFKVAQQVHQHLAQNRDKPKILYLPSYYQIKLPRMLDIVMVLALKLRGAEVIPVLTQGFFRNEDVIYGGIYNDQRVPKLKEYSWLEKRIWLDLLKTKPLFFADYVQLKDREEAFKVSQTVTTKNYAQITYKKYPLGAKAGYATLNLNNSPVMGHDQKTLFQLRQHAQNIVLLSIIYDRILNQVQPAAVVSEFPHYYQWHTAFFQAQKHKIPFYGSVMAEKKNSLFFADNSDAFLDPAAAWTSFRKKQLTATELKIMDEVIEKRKNRQVSHSNYLPASGVHHSELAAFWGQLDKNKPVVFFPVNVFFDLAVFKNSPAFHDLLDMLIQVVQYFNHHDEYQLILKAHPAEKLFYESSYANAAEYCLKNILQKHGLNLSSNIFFLDYDTPISSFDLMPDIDLGLVYTSTTPVEMAWFGKPVITVGENHNSNKGFTITPQNNRDFWRLIEKLLTHSEPAKVIKERQELSRKYYLLYYYHGFINFGLFQGHDTGAVKPTFLFDDWQALAPGSNPALDYVCNSILELKPIFGPNRWPPLTE